MPSNVFEKSNVLHLDTSYEVTHPRELMNTKSNLTEEPTANHKISKEYCAPKTTYTNNNSLTELSNLRSQSILNSIKSIRATSCKVRNVENKCVMKNRMCEKNVDSPKCCKNHSMYNYNQFSCKYNINPLAATEVIERVNPPTIHGYIKKEDKRSNLCSKKIQSFFRTPFNIFNKNIFHQGQRRYTKTNKTAPTKSWADLRVASESHVTS